MTNNNVLVTGGAGYIGSHIVLALIAAGKQPVVLDNLSTGRREVIPANVPFAEGNCGDLPFVIDTHRKHKIGSVIHCAGSIRVEESVSDPLLYYSNNTANSRTLLEGCVKEGVKYFLFSSTAAVYGSPETTPVTEETPPMPINPYGRSKLMTEVMLADSGAAYDLHYIAMRYFNVAGADSQQRAGQTGSFVSHLIRRALHTHMGKFDKLEIFGTDWPTPDGTCVRDYIHVADLAAAHVLCLDHLLKGGASRIVNCGYGHGFSVREVLKTVEAVTGKPLPMKESPRRVGDPASLVADSRWLRETLGWQPKFDNINTIITDALRWEEKLARKA